MFEIIVAVVIFLFLYAILDFGMIMSGVITFFALGLLNITIDTDKAKTEFNQVAGIEETVTEETIASRTPRQLRQQSTEKTPRYTSRFEVPARVPTEQIDIRKRDKWIAVDLSRTRNNGVAACYVDNEPGTNCFSADLRRHSDGDLYACDRANKDKCHIVRE